MCSVDVFKFHVPRSDSKHFLDYSLVKNQMSNFERANDAPAAGRRLTSSQQTWQEVEMYLSRPAHGSGGDAPRESSSKSSPPGRHTPDARPRTSDRHAHPIRRYASDERPWTSRPEGSPSPASSREADEFDARGVGALQNEMKALRLAEATRAAISAERLQVLLKPFLVKPSGGKARRRRRRHVQRDQVPQI
jgi:hypothetical protein